jgi:hypothetical protein
MSTDAFHRPGPSAMEPPASLTSVRVKRRASLVTPSGKRGDLTDGGDASATPEPTPASGAPAITQAAMDAHQRAHVAQAEAVAPPAEAPPAATPPIETMYEASPEDPVYEASQPVIVLPPPVLNGEDREAILPMTDLLPEVAAEMHAQIRMHEQDGEHARDLEPLHVPEPIIHSYQPEHQPELLLTAPLPHEPETTADPEVSFESESAAEARFVAEPEITHEPEIMYEPEAMHEPQAMHAPDIMHEPQATHAPEIMHEPQAMREPEIMPEPEAMHEPQFMHEPEIMHEPPAMAEREIVAQAAEPEITPPPEARQEPAAMMPLAAPSDTVVQLPLAAAEPETAAQTAQEEVRAPDLLDYWDGLRGVREYPVIDELDRAHIAASWPNTVLLSFKTEIPQITRIGENNGEIEYTAMVTSWLMSRGRHAVKRGEPLEEEQKFPLSNGSGRYRLLVLPMLGKGSEVCDHVLCQVTRAQERSAVASFKRWLTG